MGRSHLGPRCYQLSVGSDGISGALRGVARSAQRGDFVGRGDAVRRRSAGRLHVLLAFAVAGVAAQAFLEVRVRTEVLHLPGMARRAKFVRLLRERQAGQRD
jgi:hypothetical protein